MNNIQKQKHISLVELDRRLSVQAIATAVDKHWDDIVADLKVVRNRKGDTAEHVADYFLLIFYEIILPATNSEQYADSIMERGDDEMEIFINRIEDAIKNKEQNK